MTDITQDYIDQHITRKLIWVRRVEFEVDKPIDETVKMLEAASKSIFTHKKVLITIYEDRGSTKKFVAGMQLSAIRREKPIKNPPAIAMGEITRSGKTKTRITYRLGTDARRRARIMFLYVFILLVIVTRLHPLSFVVGAIFGLVFGLLVLGIGFLTTVQINEQIRKALTK